MRDLIEEPPNVGRASLLSQTVPKSNTTINAEDIEAGTTHIERDVLMIIMAPASIPQLNVVNQADLGQLSPTHGTVFVTDLEYLAA